MKTLKELADIGAAAASGNKCYHYISVSEKAHSWIPDEPARQAFAQAVRDAVLAELVTKTNSSPTFEAHGFTWTRHKPGDPMPCDGEAVINWLTSLEIEGAQYVHSTMKASNLLWSAPVGWRYAEPTPPVTKIVPLDVGDIRATDEFRNISRETIQTAACWDKDVVKLAHSGRVVYKVLLTHYLRRQHGSNEWKPCTKEVTV